MDGLAGVFGDERLEIREGQVQIVKFQGEKGRSREEQKVLTALDFAGEVIAAQCELKLKDNQEANLIAETDVSKAQETNKIRELYREICEIPEHRLKLH